MNNICITIIITVPLPLLLLRVALLNSLTFLLQLQEEDAKEKKIKSEIFILFSRIPATWRNGKWRWRWCEAMWCDDDAWMGRYCGSSSVIQSVSSEPKSMYSARFINVKLSWMSKRLHICRYKEASLVRITLECSALEKNAGFCF